jgi:ABC-type lipoprotein export system ATPase subunit
LSQAPDLLSQLSVLDNLRAAAWAAQLPWDAPKALALLGDLSIASLATRLAMHLSRGQAQRVALARAVLLGQGLLLADEPTANLDDAATHAVLALLKQQSERGVTILMASHDQRVAPWADTLVVMPQTTAPAYVS